MNLPFAELEKWFNATQSFVVAAGCLKAMFLYFFYVFLNTHSLRLHLSLPIGWRGWDNNYFLNSTWRRLITAIIVTCSIFFLPPYLVSLRERKNHLEVAGIEKGPPA